MRSTARRPISLAAALATVALATHACSEPPSTSVTTTAPAAAAARAGSGGAGVHRQYGEPLRLGNGRARAYALIDQKAGRTLELGVALDEQAMEGLRAPVPGADPHHDHDMLTLQLPKSHASDFRFVELNWNPQGHGAPYAEGHFDFHFWTASEAERHAIMPSDPQYAAKAAHDPAASDVPPFYFNPATALNLPPEAVAVPMMGMHWLDARAPELQGLLGKPEAYKPFTSTFIYGAWDGRLIFMEPMITRSHIVAKRDAADPAVRDQVIPISTSPSYPSGGFRPTAYRIAWDAQAREYRVALTAPE
jgi:hypothetical protein